MQRPEEYTAPGRARVEIQKNSKIQRGRADAAGPLVTPGMWMGRDGSPTVQLADPALYHRSLVHALRDLIVLDRIAMEVHGLDKAARYVLNDALSAILYVDDYKLHVRAVSRINAEPLGDGKIAGTGRPDAVPSEDACLEGQVAQRQRSVGQVPGRSGGGRKAGFEAFVG